MLKNISLAAAGILFLTTPVFATTDPIAELRIRIAELQQQLAVLMAQEGGASSSPVSSCLTLVNPLIIGSTDARTNGEVSKLQRFLMSEGVYPEALVTGYYGNLTAQAVVRWQKAHGMDFVTLTSGVGPMTRGKMKEACSGGAVSCVNGPVQGPNGLEEGKPVITSISPAYGPKGTSVRITGCNLIGFEGDAYVIFNPLDGISQSIRLTGSRGGEYNDYEYIDVIIKEPCQKGEVVYGDYSGIAGMCDYRELSLSVYNISVAPWGKMSNEVTFIITP